MLHELHLVNHKTIILSQPRIFSVTIQWLCDRIQKIM
jgi:hypothetical protein